MEISHKVSVNHVVVDIYLSSGASEVHSSFRRLHSDTEWPSYAQVSFCGGKWYHNRSEKSPVPLLFDRDEYSTSRKSISSMIGTPTMRMTRILLTICHLYCYYNATTTLSTNLPTQYTWSTSQKVKWLRSLFWETKQPCRTIFLNLSSFEFLVKGHLGRHV